MRINHPYRDYAIFRTLNSNDDYNEPNVPKRYYNNEGYHSYRWLWWLGFILGLIKNPYMFLDKIALPYIAFGFIFELVHYGYGAHESAKHDKMK